MARLLTSDKDMNWHLEEIKKHAEEIEALWERGDEPYRGEITCREHAKTEAYDLIVLAADPGRRLRSAGLSGLRGRSVLCLVVLVLAHDSMLPARRALSLAPSG